MRQVKRIEVEYVAEELQTIYVRLPELDYQRIIAEAAAQVVTKASMTAQAGLPPGVVEVSILQGFDVKGWGRSVTMHEEDDGVGIHTERWAEVRFVRPRPKVQSVVAPEAREEGTG